MVGDSHESPDRAETPLFRDGGHRQGGHRVSDRGSEAVREKEAPVACTACGQDWQTWYRVRDDGRVFLLCPECDSIWLPEDDRHASPTRHLAELFGPQPKFFNAWALIEECQAPPAD
ncbi:hypothetical protein [Micromonospora lupini]|uniref:hypothetical protein n=1 Tax=Micromonospora lupini TaxID=285679 RepID=UPI0033D051FB